MENIGLKVKIEPKLKFHEQILKQCGVQKGCFNKCIEEAIELWLKQKVPNDRIQENPQIEDE